MNSRPFGGEIPHNSKAFASLRRGGNIAA